MSGFIYSSYERKKVRYSDLWKICKTQLDLSGSRIFLSDHLTTSFGGVSAESGSGMMSKCYTLLARINSYIIPVRSGFMIDKQ